MLSCRLPHASQKIRNHAPNVFLATPCSGDQRFSYLRTTRLDDRSTTRKRNIFSRTLASSPSAAWSQVRTTKSAHLSPPVGRINAPFSFYIQIVKVFLEGQSGKSSDDSQYVFSSTLDQRELCILRVFKYGCG